MLAPNGFVISRESTNYESSIHVVPSDVEILTIHTTPSEKLVLLTKTKECNPVKATDISDTFHDFKWLSPLKVAIENRNNQDLVLFVHDDPTSGILGLVNCMRREPSGENTRCVFLQCPAPEFDSNDIFYKKQLKKGLAINVYQNQLWGTYRHLLLNSSHNASDCTVHITRKGDLSSLKWVENNQFISKQSELVQVIVTLMVLHKFDVVFIYFFRYTILL